MWLQCLFPSLLVKRRNPKCLHMQEMWIHTIISPFILWYENKKQFGSCQFSQFWRFKTDTDQQMICFKCILPSPLPASLLFQSKVLILNLNNHLHIYSNTRLLQNLLIMNWCFMRSQFHFSSLINVLDFTGLM